MRAYIASAIVAVAALTEPVATARYVVIPTAIGSHDRTPCRPALSADGRIVAFEADSALDQADHNETSDIYVFDRELRTLTLASRTWHGQAAEARVDARVCRQMDSASCSNPTHPTSCRAKAH